MRNSSTTLAAILGSLVVSCGSGAPDARRGHDEDLGQIQFAASAPPEYDVTAIRFSVVQDTATCDDPPLVEDTVPLADDVIHTDGVLQRLSRTFFVLPAGDYRACAVPQRGDGTPSLFCAAGEALATVRPRLTYPVHVPSECGGSSGAITVATVLGENAPYIQDLDIDPGFVITHCEQAILTATATDPQGDPLDYHWELLNGIAPLVGNGNVAIFGPAPLGDQYGDYSLKLVVTDPYGNYAQLEFPINVFPSNAGASCEDG